MSLRSILFIAAVTITWNSPAAAAGCQYDMQCKGDRICQQGQCMAPDSDDSDAATSKGQSGQQAQPVQPAQPVPPAQSAMRLAPASTTASAPRNCCTVAGKLRLTTPQSGDAALMVGDACQGLTATGKPVPGTACN
ncbi:MULTISPECIES: hypothetical protein [Cupriavidus]|jgi:hypothetical protein|uniref:Secreted protein n=1 Tax=Cupriavidus metallidurans TaxID=119219 RepID=A0A482IXV2_9BURK|nr:MULTISPECIES: hypothetical protein [Cupriavidus]KWR76004.1 hypothetical protein RN01_28725 [Cupriavidus sp. SHE]QBP12019.1 hypothetical protein DDF84_019760 [Cupriavidus metallidurans]QWC91984.1 hypothetical protein KB891_19830 [Cupriavidus metallidurans]